MGPVGLIALLMLAPSVRARSQDPTTGQTTGQDVVSIVDLSELRARTESDYVIDVDRWLRPTSGPQTISGSYRGGVVKMRDRLITVDFDPAVAMGQPTIFFALPFKGVPPEDGFVLGTRVTLTADQVASVLRIVPSCPSA